MTKSIYIYETVKPHAEYAPWHSDQVFCDSTWNTVGHTLCDMYRLWELWKLTEQVGKISMHGDIIEIGTYKGGSGATIALQANRECPEATIYLCDTFQGIVKCGEHETEECKDGQHIASISDVITALEKLKVKNTKILTGIFPEETQHLIPQDTVFRLCHIDVDVYQSAKDIFDWVWPRLVKHGIIVFDDYGFRHCDGITKLVNDMMLDKDKHIFHNLNGHAVIVKLE
jgi:O-methyltransferase